jgi:hypothetical protein
MTQEAVAAHHFADELAEYTANQQVAPEWCRRLIYVWCDTAELVGDERRHDGGYRDAMEGLRKHNSRQ